MTGAACALLSEAQLPLAPPPPNLPPPPLNETPDPELDPPLLKLMQLNQSSEVPPDRRRPQYSTYQSHTLMKPTNAAYAVITASPYRIAKTLR